MCRCFESVWKIFFSRHEHVEKASRLTPFVVHFRVQLTFFKVSVPNSSAVYSQLP